MAKPKNHNQAAPAGKPAELERARNPDGTFVGDDPATTGVNEAYVQAQGDEQPQEGEKQDQLEQLDGSMQDTAAGQAPEGDQQPEQGTTDTAEGEKPETLEGVEGQAPEGVETVETEQPAAPEIPVEEAVFVVVTHIKHAGKRYEPGEDVTTLTEEAAARMLASGSIKPKE